LGPFADRLGRDWSAILIRATGERIAPARRRIMRPAHGRPQARYNQRRYQPSEIRSAFL